MSREQKIDMAVRSFGPCRAAKAFNIHPDGGKWDDTTFLRESSNAAAWIRVEFRRIAEASNG